MKPGQISSTAAFIAVKFYGLTRKKIFCSLFDKDVISFYEKLVQSLPFPTRYYYHLLKFNLVRRFFIFWEELFLPGDLMHVLMRKWYLQKMVTAMHKQGYQQLLVIGAGFDHLAAIHSQKGILSVELDVPRMTAVKRQFIKQEQYQKSNLQLCEAFFSRDSLQQILEQQTCLDPAQKTMVIAEGFFDYLDKAHASAVLQDMTRFFCGPLVLFNTIFSLEELNHTRSFVYDKSIKIAGEKLKLNLNKAEYCQFLKQHGFTIRKTISSHKMEREVLKPRGISMPVLDGFYLLEARYQNNE